MKSKFKPSQSLYQGITDGKYIYIMGETYKIRKNGRCYFRIGGEMVRASYVAQFQEKK